MKTFLLTSFSALLLLASCDVPNHPDAQKAREKLRYRKPAVIKPAEFYSMADSLGRIWAPQVDTKTFVDSISKIEGVGVHVFDSASITNGNMVEQSLYEALKNVPVGTSGQLTEQRDTFYFTTPHFVDSTFNGMSSIVFPKQPTLVRMIVDERERRRKSK